MSCCVENAQIATVVQAVSVDEMQVASRALGDGFRQLDLSVPGVHTACASRISRRRSARSRALPMSAST